MSTSEFTRRMLIAIALGLLLLLLWEAADLLLIGFGAVMMAVMLSASSNALSRYTGMRRSLALALTSVLLVAIVAGVFTLFGSQLGAQMAQLTQTIPASLNRLRGTLGDTVWGKRLFDELRNVDLASAGGNMVARAFGAFTSLLGVLTDGLLIFFSGLYLAAQPDLYRDGLISLVPPAHRPRAREVLDALYHALRQWLLGQLVSMIAVGVLFAIALSLIGVPSPLVLGLIAALSEFIPLLGPVLATIPAMLVALSQSSAEVVWVVVAFLIIQQTESNLLVPFIQRRAAHLPPVVALFATVLFSLMFGVAGLLFAVPLAVSAMVLVKMVYVESILGGAPEDEQQLPRRRILGRPVGRA